MFGVAGVCPWYFLMLNVMNALQSSVLMSALLISAAALVLMSCAAHRLLFVQVPELGWWVLGLALLSAGSGLAIGGPSAGHGLQAFASVVLVASGLVLGNHALYRRADHRASPLWVRGWYVLILATAATLLMSGGWRELDPAVVSAVYAAFLAPGVWVSMRSLRPGRASPVLASVGLLLLAVMAALTMRALSSVLPEAWVPPALDGPVSVWWLLTGCGLGLVSLAFAWSCVEQVLNQTDSMGSHDGLTGCINRPTGRTILGHTLRRARRQREPVGLLTLDIDHFRRLNQRLGQPCGDVVLQSLADAVRSRLRSSDVFCRWDGDQFNVILPSTDAPGARRLAEDICRTIARLKIRTPRHAEVGLSASVGVAVAIPDSESTVEELIARAENALAKAKQAGRNRVEQACVEMTLVSSQ